MNGYWTIFILMVLAFLGACFGRPSRLLAHGVDEKAPHAIEQASRAVGDSAEHKGLEEEERHRETASEGRQIEKGHVWVQQAMQTRDRRTLWKLAAVGLFIAGLIIAYWPTDRGGA